MTPDADRYLFHSSARLRPSFHLPAITLNPRTVLYACRVVAMEKEPLRGTIWNNLRIRINRELGIVSGQPLSGATLVLILESEMN